MVKTLASKCKTCFFFFFSVLKDPLFKRTLCSVDRWKEEKYNTTYSPRTTWTALTAARSDLQGTRSDVRRIWHNGTTSAGSAGERLFYAKRHWMNRLTSLWPRCDGCLPPSEDGKKQEVETDKEMKKRTKRKRWWMWAYMKWQRPGGRDWQIRDCAKRKSDEKICRLRAEIVCPLLKATFSIKDSEAFLSHRVVQMRKEVWRLRSMP